MPALTLLVDGPSLIYRSHFAMREGIFAADGSPIAAAHGFLSMLARLIADLKPVRLVTALDADWRPDWRVDLVPEYKTHRLAPENEAVDDVIDVQTELIARILKLARVAAVGAPGCEAEDVIATLLTRVRGRVSIVSGDRDLFQLVRDPDVVVLYPKRGVSDLARIDEAEITRRYNVPGRAYADFAILRGDPSDGLPGVRGVGEKTAAMLIAKYGSLEAVVAASAGARSGPLAKVAADADYVRRAAEVVRMKGDCSVGEVDMTLGGAPSPKLKALAKQYSLTGPVNRLLAAIPRSAPRE